MRRKSITISILEVKGSGTAATKNLRTDFKATKTDEVLTYDHGLKRTTFKSGSEKDVASPKNLPTNAISFCYVNQSDKDCTGLPNITGTILDFSSISNNYRTQLLSDYKNNNLYFRVQNGDSNGDWHDWVTFFHSNNMPWSLKARDNRNGKPKDFLKGHVYPTLTANSNIGLDGNYSDLLILDCYSDNTAGKANAIALRKDINALYHIQYDQGSDSWGKPEKIYTTAQKPTPEELRTSSIGSPNFGGTQGYWTTEEFVAWLKANGCFRGTNFTVWLGRGGWSYGGNKTIIDSSTGVGGIPLAGSVVEVFGNEREYTIRITTPTTIGGEANNASANREFIYVNNGETYQPRWRASYNTMWKPSPAEIGAVNKAGDTMTGALTVFSYLTINTSSGGRPFRIYNWGNASRPNVYEVQEMQPDGGAKWHFYTESHADGSIYFKTNGNMNVNGYFQAYGDISSTKGSITSYAEGSNNAYYWLRRASDGLEYGVLYAGADRVVKLRNNLNGVPNTHQFTGGMIYKEGPELTGSDKALIRGTLGGGSWETWRDRSAGILIDCPNSYTQAYNVWKATHWGSHHIASMDVHSDGDKICYAKLHVGNTSFDFRGNGDFYAPRNGNFNDVYIRSDIRDKKSIKYINNSLKRLKGIVGCTYYVKNSNGYNLSGGVIAQHVLKTLPEAVQEDLNHEDNKRLRVNYNAVTGLLVNSVNCLDDKYELLYKKFIELETKFNKLIKGL